MTKEQLRKYEIVKLQKQIDRNKKKQVTEVKTINKTIEAIPTGLTFRVTSTAVEYQETAV